MQTSVRAPFQQKSKHQTDSIQRKSVGAEPKHFDFEDRRSVAVTQRKLSELVNGSSRVVQQRSVARDIGDSPHVVQQKDDLLRVASVQLARQPVAKPNRTGMPDRLKSGVEALSGMSMDHVRVHYNSSQPAQLNAHAYAQGSDIHLGPGQEKHLPHEAWHVVQQAQGRVKATRQMAGGGVNDDVGLEGEADLMGKRAAGVVQLVWQGNVGMLELNHAPLLIPATNKFKYPTTKTIQRLISIAIESNGPIAVAPPCLEATDVHRELKKLYPEEQILESNSILQFLESLSNRSMHFENYDAVLNYLKSSITLESNRNTTAPSMLNSPQAEIKNISTKRKLFSAQPASASHADSAIFTDETWSHLPSNASSSASSDVGSSLIAPMSTFSMSVSASAAVASETNSIKEQEKQKELHGEIPQTKSEQVRPSSLSNHHILPKSFLGKVYDILTKLNIKNNYSNTVNPLPLSWDEAVMAKGNLWEGPSPEIRSDDPKDTIEYGMYERIINEDHPDTKKNILRSLKAEKDINCSTVGTEYIDSFIFLAKHLSKIKYDAGDWIFNHNKWEFNKGQAITNTVASNSPHRLLFDQRKKKIAEDKAKNEKIAEDKAKNEKIAEEKAKNAENGRRRGQIPS